MKSLPNNHTSSKLNNINIYSTITTTNYFYFTTYSNCIYLSMQVPEPELPATTTNYQCQGCETIN